MFLVNLYVIIYGTVVYVFYIIAQHDHCFIKAQRSLDLYAKCIWNCGLRILYNCSIQISSYKSVKKFRLICKIVLAIDFNNSIV